MKKKNIKIDRYVYSIQKQIHCTDIIHKTQSSWFMHITFELQYLNDVSYQLRTKYFVFFTRWEYKCDWIGSVHCHYSVTAFSWIIIYNSFLLLLNFFFLFFISVFDSPKWVFPCTSIIFVKLLAIRILLVTHNDFIAFNITYLFFSVEKPEPSDYEFDNWIKSFPLFHWNWIVICMNALHVQIFI